MAERSLIHSHITQKFSCRTPFTPARGTGTQPPCGRQLLSLGRHLNDASAPSKGKTTDGVTHSALSSRRRRRSIDVGNLDRPRAEAVGSRPHGRLQGRRLHHDRQGVAIRLDTSGAAYTAGAIETVRDLNGDGFPDAVVTEGSTYCYGMTGTGYVLVTKQANGTWKRITSGAGVPTFLDSKGVGGWPDIEVGGPGFCFPVERWNGKEYVLNRRSYEGKPC
jgi:hypothetical protein